MKLQDRIQSRELAELNSRNIEALFRYVAEISRESEMLDVYADSASTVEAADLADRLLRQAARIRQAEKEFRKARYEALALILTEPPVAGTKQGRDPKGRPGLRSPAVDGTV
jgi:hypothetical protein